MYIYIYICICIYIYTHTQTHMYVYRYTYSISFRHAYKPHTLNTYSECRFTHRLFIPDCEPPGERPGCLCDSRICH